MSLHSMVDWWDRVVLAESETRFAGRFEGVIGGRGGSAM